jgi:Tol biopolymer transport system component
VDATETVHVVDYQSAVSSELATGFSPSITDDGQWVYYVSENCEAFKIPATGGAATKLTTTPPYACDAVVVSGANTAVAFGADGGEFPGGNNPDASLELWVTDIDGNAFQQLTQIDAVAFEDYVDPDITPDGGWIIAVGLGEVYRMRSDGSDYARLTFTDGPNGTGAEHPSLAQDGDTVVFDSWVLAPLGVHVFAIENDGTQLFQLAPQNAHRPVLGKVSNVVVFQEVAGQLYTVPLDGPGPTQLTMDGDTFIKYHRVDYGAEWVVYGSRADPLGSNPDHSAEIFRIRTDGSGLQQLTSAPNGVSLLADVSADGSRVVFRSNTDPLGQNPDGNGEIFLFDVTTSLLQQLTVTTSDNPGWFPRISGNGAYVFFPSAHPFFEYPSALYRMKVATGTVERCDGLPYHPGGLLNQYNDTNAAVAVDYSGDRVAFVGWIDGVGKNGDGSAEVFLADFSATPRIEVSSSDPTVLSWEPDPRGVRYDVVRGDLANLQPGAGGTVDLGPVVCLEDDSPDTTTNGFEDPATPAPDQGYFYLYRFTQGPPDGPGSWGQGTGDAERIPGAGTCTD